MPTDNKNCIEKFQDPMYASLFLHESWRELLEMAEPGKAEVSFLLVIFFNFVKNWVAKSAKKGFKFEVIPHVLDGMWVFFHKAFHNKDLQIVILVQIY